MQFLVLAHVVRAGVVTFNYDTLLECLTQIRFGPLDEADVRDYGYRVSWDELSGGTPAWPPGPARLGATPRDTMRLLKLHGSLNWYWSPGDATGATVAKRDLPGSWLAPEPYTEEDRQRHLPGRVPFVVPPTATKHPFYGSPQLHEVWSQAYHRLRQADRVFLLGYSIPPTDTTTSSMLRMALGGGRQHVVIADLHPEQVVKNLHQIGISTHRIRSTPTTGDLPIANLVENLARERSIDVRDEMLRLAPPGEPLMVSWGNHAHAGVTGIHDDGRTTVLTTEPAQPKLARTARSRGQMDARLGTVGELATTRGNPLVVEKPDGTRQHILGHRQEGFAVGASESWRILRPGGLPDADPPLT